MTRIKELRRELNTVVSNGGPLTSAGNSLKKSDLDAWQAAVEKAEALKHELAAARREVDELKAALAGVPKGMGLK